MPEKTVSRLDCTISFLLAVVLALNLLLPVTGLLAIQLYADDVPEQVSAVSAGKVLVCTSTGYRYISLEDFQNGTVPTEDTDPHCPLCTLQKDTCDPATPATTSILATYSPPSPLAETKPLDTLPHPLAYSLQPRAPPPLSFS